MSSLAHSYSLDNKIFSDRVRKCNRFSFQWRDLVAPSFGYGFGKLSWEQTLVLLEHIVEKINGRRSKDWGGWGNSGPLDQLNASSGNGNSGMHPLRSNWEDDLRKRFQHLVLGWPRSQAMVDVAEELGYPRLDSMYIIRQRTYRYGSEIISNARAKALITSLHNVQGRTAQWLNHYHKRARTVTASGLHFGGPTYLFIYYGYAHDKGGGGWRETIATRNKGELMLDFLIRGAADMQEAVTGYQSPCPQPDPKVQQAGRRTSGNKRLSRKDY